MDDQVTNAMHWSSQMAKSMEDLKSQFEAHLRNKQGISTSVGVIQQTFFKGE